MLEVEVQVESDGCYPFIQRQVLLVEHCYRCDQWNNTGVINVRARATSLTDAIVIIFSFHYLGTINEPESSFNHLGIEYHFATLSKHYAFFQSIFPLQEFDIRHFIRSSNMDTLNCFEFTSAEIGTTWTAPSSSRLGSMCSDNQS